MNGNSKAEVNITETSEEISLKINQLIESKKNHQSIDKQTILQQVFKLINKIGINEDDINILFDLIFDLNSPNYLSVSQKRFIIKNLLVPNQTYVLSQDIIYRIISSIGAPQVYYKNGKRVRQKKLSVNLQLHLLEWLVCSIHLFGIEVFNILNRMLPILFNYLSYEFSRPYIANLIFLSVSNNNKTVKTYLNEESTHIISSFKPWHVQLVVELFYKFPLDDYLKSLLILFKTLNPNLDFQQFSNDSTYDYKNLGYINPKIFIYPNFDYLDKLNDIKLINYQNEIFKDNDLVLNNNLRKYNSFSSILQNRKRLKITTNEQIDLDIIEIDTNVSQISINDIHSVQNLVDNFENIKFINIHHLFDPHVSSEFMSDKFKKLFLILQTLSADNKKLNKLDYYVRFSLLDDNLSVKEIDLLTDKIAEFLGFSPGTCPLPSVQDFILFKFTTNPIAANSDSIIIGYENLNQRLKLLKFLPILNFSDFNESFLQNVFKLLIKVPQNKAHISKREEVVASFLYRISSFFSSWYLATKVPNSGSDSRFKVIDLIKNSIPLIYQFIIDHFLSSSLKIKISILSLLNFVKSIDINDINEFFDAKFLIVNPSLLYNLLFSNSPLVFSEVCGYVAFCKNYTFEYHEEQIKSIQTSYIMDILNFIWRDKAFYYELNHDSKHKSMCLAPEFINKLGTLHTFNYSNLISLNTIGNLFRNPCWSYITAQIIWEFEDNSENITTRHEGPVSEESVSKLKHENELVWLDLSYRQLKVEVLKRLDSLGYNGLCDLLFSSLASLLNERHQS